MSSNHSADLFEVMASLPKPRDRYLSAQPITSSATGAASAAGARRRKTARRADHGFVVGNDALLHMQVVIATLVHNPVDALVHHSHVLGRGDPD